MTACHVLNRIPTKNKEITPFEEWEKKRPTLSYLRTWGCLAKMSVPITKKRKLGPKTVDCVFLGYAIHNVGYRFLIVKSGVPDMHVGTIMESRDATFFENIFPMRDGTRSSRQEFIEADSFAEPIEHNEPTLVKNPEEDNNDAPRKSKRQRTVKSFSDDFVVYLMDDTPRTIEEAYSSLDAEYWKEAVRSEMDSIMSMEPERSLNVLMDVNRLDASGCSRKSSSQMVLLRSTRLGLWPRVIPRKKEKISLIFIHLLPD